MWDSTTGVPLNSDIGQTGMTASDLAWTSSGIFAVVVESGEASLTRWTVNPDQVVASACELVGWNLTREEWAH